MKRIVLFFLAFTTIIGMYASDKGPDIDSLKNELRTEIIRNDKELQKSRKDSILLSKLSPNQLLEIKQSELEVEKLRVENDGRNDMPFSGIQLLMMCLLPFLFVVAIIYIVTMAKNKELQRRYDLYMKSLEMGQAVPEHFFVAPKKTNQPTNFQKGALWLAVGLAVLISFLIVGKYNMLVFGIIPTFVGIGYLLIHFLDKPKSDKNSGNNEQHG